MIVIAGRIVIDPARREDAVAAARAVMAETCQEAGCFSYTFSADLGDAATFHLFEEWEGDEALASHFETPHMARFQTAMATLGVREMKVQRYEVSSVGPLRRERGPA